MSDTIDDFRFMKLVRAARYRIHGVKCPRCGIEQPKRQATILLPGERCRVHQPAYVDPRPDLTKEQEDACWDAVQAEVSA